MNQKNDDAVGQENFSIFSRRKKSEGSLESWCTGFQEERTSTVEEPQESISKKRFPKKA